MLAQKRENRPENLLQQVIDLRHLLSDQERWTQGNYARTTKGIGCTPKSPEAVQWCLYGAAEKVEGEFALRAFGPLVDLLRETAVELWPPQKEEYIDDPILYVNDVLGFEGVQKLLRVAEEKLTEPTPPEELV